jgi:hypothetical protein
MLYAEHVVVAIARKRGLAVDLSDAVVYLLPHLVATATATATSNSCKRGCDHCQVLPSSFMTHYPVCFATTLSSTQTSRPKHVEWKEVADPPSTPDSRKSLNSESGEGGEEEIRVTDEDIETTGDLGFGPRSKMLAKNWRDDDDDRRIRRRSFGSLSPYMFSVSISSSSSSALARLFACANRPACCCCMKTWTTTPLSHNNPTTKHHSHNIQSSDSHQKTKIR